MFAESMNGELDCASIYKDTPSHTLILVKGSLLPLSLLHGPPVLLLLQSDLPPPQSNSVSKVTILNQI